MTLSDILLAVLATTAKAGGEFHMLWIFTNSLGYLKMGHQKYTRPILRKLFENENTRRIKSVYINQNCLVK